MNPLGKEWFQKQKVDAVLIQTSEQMQDPLLTKFTGIFHTDFPFKYVQTPGKEKLICGSLEEGAVRQHYKGSLGVVRKREDVKTFLKPFFARKTVGVNLGYITAAQFQSLKKHFPSTKFKDVGDALVESRKIKTKEEIRKLKEGARITQEVVHSIHKYVKSGMKEIELAAEVDHQFHRNGCGNSFPTIVAFGKNARNIHHFNGNAKLKKGDVVLIDSGAKFEGYCADLSRTFVFGKASTEQEEWYAKCYTALQESMKTIAPSVKAKVSFARAEEVLGKRIPHALGHGIGLETHDVPSGIGPSAEWAFEANMCLAVEPGFYGKTFGIRIEENGLVGKSEFQVWSKAPKKLVEW